MSASTAITPVVRHTRRWQRIKLAGAVCAAAGLILIGAFAAWARFAWDRSRWAEARQVSTTIVDRNGKLLRAYAMTDGRWRLPVDAKTNVDPGYLKLLLAYEDRRFRSHAGVDPFALGRAAFQLLTRGHIVSGGSTITMQLARLIEPRRERSIAAKLRQMVRAIEIERQLTKDQNSRSVSGTGALWRQSRRYSRRFDRLFRQGAETIVAGGIGAAGGAAAIAGKAPSRPLSRCRACGA